MDKTIITSGYLQDESYINKEQGNGKIDDNDRVGRNILTPQANR
jgi:hypothetical protein